MDPVFLTRTTAAANPEDAGDQQLGGFAPSEDLILSYILREQDSGTEERCLTFHPVETETVSGVIATLIYTQEKAWRYSWNSLLKTFAIVINACRVHECHGYWLHVFLGQAMRQKFISWQDYADLQLLAYLDKFQFATPYTHSAKEPDQCVIPVNSKVPTLVVEAGWGESRAQLLGDMYLWLHGGRPDAQLVILLKWTKLSGNRVEGDVQVFGRGETGHPVFVQREIIYPAPANATKQAIRITKRHLWGRHLPDGYNEDESFDLSLDLLRGIALPAIKSEDCTPA